MARRPKGSKRCGAQLSDRSGRSCRAWAVAGTERCWKHGSGSVKRVREGKRKPPGRPPTTGEHIDPAKTHYSQITALAKQLADDPHLLNMTPHVAYMEAVCQIEVKKFVDGQWDAMKTERLPEHFGTWLIEQKAKIVAAIDRMLRATFRDRLRAATFLLEPLIKAIDHGIEQFVEPDKRDAFRARLQQAVEEFVVVPE